MVQWTQTGKPVVTWCSMTDQGRRVVREVARTLDPLPAAPGRSRGGRQKGAWRGVPGAPPGTPLSYDRAVERVLAPWGRNNYRVRTLAVERNLPCHVFLFACLVAR